MNQISHRIHGSRKVVLDCFCANCGELFNKTILYKNPRNFDLKVRTQYLCGDC